MEKNTIQFSNKPGTFRDSIRAYREYKKDWQARMEVKLSKMEEEIQKAKSDQFYKIETRQEAATKNNEDWPRLTKEDLTISPEVMKIVEDIDPLTEDFDEKKARLEYLTKKYGL